ncbi:MAG: 30S ribosomal protein S20 [Ignavibacteria bacterium]|nr:30S ribosomal protein S20 [Ignavibacteria bacterium]
MAHHKSAIKRIRQTRKRKIYNRANMKTVREAIKAVRAASTLDTAQAALSAAFSALDRVTARGIMKKNTVAHRKSSLSRHVRTLESA